MDSMIQHSTLTVKLFLKNLTGDAILEYTKHTAGMIQALETPVSTTERSFYEQYKLSRT